jgi:hypothetical protein
MVCPYLVVQKERLIAVAPVVADSRFAFDDERRHVELAESGRSGEAGLATTDDDDFGIFDLVPRGVVGRGRDLAWGAAVRGVGGHGTTGPDTLRAFLEIFHRQRECPGAPLAGVGAQ